MGGVRCILTGFTVGMMLGVGGYYAAVYGSVTPVLIGLHADALEYERGAVEAVVHEYDGFAGGKNSSIRTEPSENSFFDSEAADLVSIGNERGGYITDYTQQMLKWREKGISLRFTGRCDSACTLYLALPYHQTCIAEGASFRFHAPTAETWQARQVALDYILGIYPAWIRSWIDAKGGLSEDLITMDYEYARGYMRTCDAKVPKQAVRAENISIGAEFKHAENEESKMVATSTTANPGSVTTVEAKVKSIAPKRN